MTELISSTGLGSRTAAALAYGGWWISGLIMWLLERRDRYARFHAAQAIVAFGGVAMLILLCGVLAAAQLGKFPSAFSVLVGATIVAWIAGVVLWAVSLWKAANGAEWRIPFAADFADRLV